MMATSRCAPSTARDKMAVSGATGPKNGDRYIRRKINDFMVLLVRIELTASPLPRECSTTELQQRRDAEGRVS